MQAQGSEGCRGGGQGLEKGRRVGGRGGGAEALRAAQLKLDASALKMGKCKNGSAVHAHNHGGGVRPRVGLDRDKTMSLGEGLR